MKTCDVCGLLWLDASWPDCPGCCADLAIEALEEIRRELETMRRLTEDLAAQVMK